jgi:hypothetical protein
MSVFGPGIMALELPGAVRPLVEALTTLGVEIGTCRLTSIGKMIGFGCKHEWNELRVLCVRVPSRDDCLHLLVHRLRSAMSDDDLDNVLPVAGIDLPDGRVLVAFLGAIGLRPTVH